MEDGRWITLKDGRRVFIKATNQYMNDFIRNSIIANRNKNQSVKQEQPKKLSELEYERLCEEFEETLTDEEKKQIKSYGVGGGVSSYLNDPVSRDFERTYRFEDVNNPKGYVEKKVSYLNALDTKLDKRFVNIKTGNESWEEKNWNENIKWNYDMIERDRAILNKMDKIFNKKGVSLDKDIIVYRKGHETLEDLQNGVIRYGYTSTSAKSRINKSTPGGLKLGSNEFEIIVPKGMKFLPIKNLVDDDIKSQHEILLPRKLQFSLVSNDTTSADWKFTSSGKMRWQPQKNKFVVRVKQV